MTRQRTPARTVKSSPQPRPPSAVLSAGTLNLEGLYCAYKNYQVSARDILTGQNLAVNAAKVTICGIQLDARFCCALFTHQTGARIDGNINLDLNLGYFSAGDRWYVQAFVRNLTDALAKTSCGKTIPGPTGCFVDAPRTYGATLGIEY